MEELVLAHGHLVGLVDDDVGGLQQGVAQEAVAAQIRHGVLQLLLVGGHPLQPAQGRHHGQQQVQLGVLDHLGLDE